MALVTLQYDDLINGVDVTQQIYEAFGPNSLGALSVAGIPGYSQLVNRLLPLSHQLGHLPPESLSRLEHPQSLWNTGWSMGREKLGGVTPDFSKGSFYANPVVDEAPENYTNDPNPAKSTTWPSEEIPDLEPAFKTLGTLMRDVTLLVAMQIDRLVASKIPEYTPILYESLKQSTKVKGRLLYYYPTDNANEDSWIGWHNDSGFLTALSQGVFFNDDTGELVENPDSNGGLWIVTRGSDPVKVDIPADHLGIQLGECCQIVTGGLLVATPHAVRASANPPGQRIGRASFPVFVGCDNGFVLNAPPGITREQVFDKTPDSRVPPLPPRWQQGQTYDEFLKLTFSKFYEHNKEGGSTY